MFANLDGTQFYVTAYLSAAISVMGFMGTPTHLAGYREGGVLRRFRAAAIPARAVVFSQAAVLARAGGVGAVADAGTGLRRLRHPGAGIRRRGGRRVRRRHPGLRGIGTLLGSLLPGARSAQGVGLLLFFGTFLLVGGGPPPGVFPDALNAITRWTPTGLLIDAIRAPWSGNGLDARSMVTLLVICAAGFALANRRLSRS